METVNSLTAAASKAIWGDSTKEEPLSGETGDVKAGEPYDRGNVEGAEPRVTKEEEPATETTTAETLIEPLAKDTSTKTPSAEDETSTKDLPAIPTSSEEPSTSTDSPESAPQSLPIRSAPDASKPSEASSNEPASAIASDLNPSTNKDSASHLDKQSDEHDASESTKKEADDAAKIETSLEAPRTLEELAQSKPSSSTDATSTEPKTAAVQTESQGEGTGELYVKSTGVKADGGNFDASAPGAGKEATRLLEEQGVHRTAASPTASPAEKVSSEENVSGGKEKLSLKEKIKAKLHKHKD